MSNDSSDDDEAFESCLDEKQLEERNAQLKLEQERLEAINKNKNNIINKENEINKNEIKDKEKIEKIDELKINKNEINDTNKKINIDKKEDNKEDEITIKEDKNENIKD
jgi:hypothetical protein